MLRRDLSLFFLATMMLSGLEIPRLWASTKSYATGAKVQHKKVKSGDTVYSLLRSHGFSETQAARALASRILPTKFGLIPGDIFRAVPSPSEFTLLFFDPQRDFSYRFWRRGRQEAGGERLEMNYLVRVKTLSGKIKGPILSSLMKYGVDEMVAYRFLDAYIIDYDLTRVLERGADFSLTFEEKFEDGQFVKFGEITKTSLEIRGKTETREFVRFPGGGTFIDPSNPQTDRTLFAPVDYLRITSVFKRARFHPIRRKRIAHHGTDFELPEGENIYSAGPGRVIKRGRNRGAGYYVAVDHGGGLSSYYNHLSEIHHNIHVGSRVENGQVLGAVGCTGYCTKPHLHFAVKKRGQFVDPLDFIKSYPYAKRKAIAPIFARNSGESVRGQSPGPSESKN